MFKVCFYICNYSRENSKHDTNVCYTGILIFLQLLIFSRWLWCILRLKNHTWCEIQRVLCMTDMKCKLREAEMFCQYFPGSPCLSSRQLWLPALKHLIQESRRVLTSCFSLWKKLQLCGMSHSPPSLIKAHTCALARTHTWEGIPSPWFSSHVLTCMRLSYFCMFNIPHHHKSSRKWSD